MRGAKPKPVEQKIREGNLGKRKLPAPIELPDVKVRKPENLPAPASELWDEIVPVLSQAQVLNQIDRAALEGLCIQWARSVQARVAIAKEGLFALGSVGQVVPHPALEIERAGHGLFIRFAEQFGITPVARARIAAAVTGIEKASMAEELAAIFGDDDVIDA